MAACGGGDDDVASGGDGGGGAVATTTSTWPPLLQYEVGVASVDQVIDELHLSITSQPLPGPEGAGDCGLTLVDVTDDLTRPASSVGVVVVRLAVARTDGQPFAATFDGTFAGCDLAPRPFVVDLAEPLAGRLVQVEQPFSRWLPQGDGSLVRCELPACDPETGEPPDPDGCDHTLVDAVRAGDVPRRSGVDVAACGGGFAVVDIDLGAGACPAAGDGAPNPCAGERVDRTFWSRDDDGTWVLHTYGVRGEPGCASAELPPGFPATLCEDLPPVG